MKLSIKEVCKIKQKKQLKFLSSLGNSKLGTVLHKTVFQNTQVELILVEKHTLLSN